MNGTNGILKMATSSSILLLINKNYNLNPSGSLKGRKKASSEGSTKPSELFQSTERISSTGSNPEQALEPNSDRKIREPELRADSEKVSESDQNKELFRPIGAEEEEGVSAMYPSLKDSMLCLRPRGSVEHCRVSHFYTQIILEYIYVPARGFNQCAQNRNRPEPCTP